MQDRQVSLTGGSGFVGFALARALAGRGARIRALVRTHSQRAALEALAQQGREQGGFSLELCEGDLLDPDSRRALLAGAQDLFHVAADYRIWVPDAAAMEAVNVGASRDLLREAGEAGVERMVYTSSVAAIAPPQPGRVSDEDTPTTEHQLAGVYKRSKFRAEQAVLALAAEGLKVVVVNPSAPMGPGDHKPTPTGRIVVEAGSGKMPGYVDTGLNVVHVTDVAEGHIQAMEQGVAGRRYILGGENLPLSEILAQIAACAGVRRPAVRLPLWPLAPVAHVAEGWARMTGREPFVTRDALDMARRRMYYTSDRAIRELGYRPRPAAQAIEDAVDWFRQDGRLA